MASSQLPHLLHQYQRYLHRIDALEQKLEETVTAKRQRAAGLLEIIPTHRSSHLRLFVTHHVDETTTTTTSSKVNRGDDAVKKQKWTLVLEGRLLVGYLDHENAFLADSESASPMNSNSTVPIHSSTLGNSLSTAGTAAAAASSWNNSNLNTTTSENTTAAAAGSNRLSRDFTNRGFCDNDFEEAPPMIQFTHFFDKVSVSIQPFYRSLPRGNDNTLGGDEGGGGKMKRVLKELSSTGSKRKSIDGEGKADPFMTLGNIVTLHWERESNPTTSGPSTTAAATTLEDAQAIHIVYDDIPQDKETVLVATIQLYKRLDSVDMYKTSEALASLLFPQILQEDERNKKKMVALTSKMTDNFLSPKKKARASMNNVVQSNMDGRFDLGVNTTADNKALSIVPKYTSLPMDNDIYIPTLLSMEDIMGALLRYIKDRDLVDNQDPSMICNNVPLVNLFECNVMSLATMKGLLLSRKLIEKVGVMDHPIVLTYLMKNDGGVSRVNDQIYDSTISSEVKPSSSEAKDATQDNPTGIVDSAMNVKGIDDSDASLTNDTTGSKSIVGPYPNFLTFDMDVEVPTLFAFRTREILGRIKRREFEWTNARTKALRMVQASKVEEELIKEKLEDIVKGRGVSKDHIPILLALARTSSGGSQAQICAHIDARTAFLMQRLEHHTSLAEACWDVVEGLRNNR